MRLGEGVVSLVTRAANLQQTKSRPHWLALHREEAIDPARPIVDAHHHLYLREGHRYLLGEYLADIASGHNITASVIVQARSMLRASGPDELRPVGETEFANGVAAMAASGRYGAAAIGAGIVGYADLRMGDAVAPLLEAHAAAAPDRFRGIRQIAVWDKDAALVNPAYLVPEDLFERPDFRTGYARLAEYSLSFDAWLYFHQLPRLTALANAFPHIPIVVDHCGGILGVAGYSTPRADVFNRWRAALGLLAKCPNVMMKIGGLGMRISGFAFADRDRPPTSTDLAVRWRPWVETCLELFGADRCMFESNFPVDAGSYAFGIGLNAMKRIADVASDAEKSQFFSGSARRFYRLGEC